jgi:molybdate transport system substrate-binding protein
MRRRTTSVATVLCALVTLAAGCGDGSGDGSSGKPASVTVFAASSLTDAFTAIGKDYESAHPGAKVTFSFAASSNLVQQVQQGAPADVLATASTKTMDEVSKELADPARSFARNKLVIVTAPGNPLHITTLSDLARKGIVVVLAAEGVPAGDYARQALADARVTVHPKSLEDNVRGVLTKVELGEADAGVVYVTDALVAGKKVASVPVPGAPVATYPIGAVTDDGRAFVDAVLSSRGQQILARYGFLSP